MFVVPVAAGGRKPLPAESAGRREDGAPWESERSDAAPSAERRPGRGRRSRELTMLEDMERTRLHAEMFRILRVRAG